MPFEFEHTGVPGVILVHPTKFEDHRGFFVEAYKLSAFAAVGIDRSFVQDNHSRSRRATLRGLHYQTFKPQGKLIRVVVGEIFDVAVDIRRGAPTFGRWVGVALSADNRRMVYVPPWCAHGFCVVSDEAEVIYKTTEEYAPEYEHGIMWNDQSLAIRWPVSGPILSERDRRWPGLHACAGFGHSAGTDYGKDMRPVDSAVGVIERGSGK